MKPYQLCLQEACAPWGFALPAGSYVPEVQLVGETAFAQTNLCKVTLCFVQTWRAQGEPDNEVTGIVLMHWKKTDCLWKGLSYSK